MSGSIRFFFAALGLAASAAFAQSNIADFDLPAQTLAESLRAVASTTHINVLFDTGKIAERRAPALKGRITADEALTKLLEGSGLTYRFLDEKTVVLAADGEGKEKGKRTTGSSQQDAALRLAQAPSADSSQASIEGQRGEDNETAKSDSSSEKSDGKPIELLEEIVVTGSRLQRVTRRDSVPVTVFDRESIERLGITTAGDILRVIPQNQGTAGTNPFNTLGAARYPNLRGLGEGTTLVLINGQRPASTAGASSGIASTPQTNLDIIPTGAIERIEILRDGASAIYGSDAIGGVINIILRRDYRGVELSAKYLAANAVGFAENNYSAVLGGRVGGLSAMVGADYYDRDGTYGSQRRYSASLDKTPFGGTVLFADPFFSGPIPANVSAFPGTGNLPGLSSAVAAVPGGEPRALQPSDLLEGQTNEIVGFSSFTPVVSPHKRASGFGHADLTASDVWSLNADAFYSTSKTARDFGFPFVDQILGAANPYNPFGVDALVSFYLLDLPGAGGAVRSKTEDYGVSVGIKAQATPDWQIRGNLNFGESRLDEEEGFADPTLVSSALIATDPDTALNPLFSGRGNSPELLRSFMVTLLDGLTKVRNRGISVGAAGTVLSLPTGKIDVALGGETRNELLDTRTTDIFSLEPTVIDKDRDIHAAYLELGIPLLRQDDPEMRWRSLELSLAARYERYSDFGDTTNPKVGLRWQPIHGLTLRGTWGTAFQAPSLSQIHTAPSVTPGFVFGPVFDPVLNQAYPLSGAVIRQGNEDLQPQEADTLSLGLSYERPLERGKWNASLDIYRIDFTDRIRTALSNQELIDLETLFPQFIIRDPGTQQITDIISVPINLASVDTSGVDFSLGYALPLLGGTIDAALAGAVVSKYDIRISPLTSIEDRRSYVGFSNRLKGNFQLQYSRPSWSAGVIVYHAASYRSDVQPDRDIRSQTTLDVQFSYRCCGFLQALSHEVKLTVGMINLFDRAPPFYDALQGFDFGEGDPLQRRIYGKVAVTF